MKVKVGAVISWSDFGGFTIVYTMVSLSLSETLFEHKRGKHFRSSGH